MSWFYNNKKVDVQFRNVGSKIFNGLNDEYIAGYSYGFQEYSGSWQGKNWKDELDKFAKSLQKYERISFLSEANDFGIKIGKLHGMLSSDLLYSIMQDDKAAGLLCEIFGKLKSLKGFEMSELCKRVNRIKLKKLNEEGLQNLKHVLNAMNPAL